MAALACGLATVDVVQTVERVPAPDEKVVALATRVEAGGPALNAATTAALLGMPCRLVTAVGAAPLAAVVRADCAWAGVELADVAVDGFELPVATVLLTRSTGERAVVSRGALGPETAMAPAPDAVDGLLDGIRAVLVDGHHLGVAVPLAAAARARGIPVLLDAGSWKPGLPDLMTSVDVLLASAAFHPPTGGSLADLLALGPTWVARSAGAGPVRWAAADGAEGSVDVPAVPHVVDTLGAGDVLHGALLAELARHDLADLPGALRRSVAVATRSVQAARSPRLGRRAQPVVERRTSTRVSGTRPRDVAGEVLRVRSAASRKAPTVVSAAPSPLASSGANGSTDPVATSSQTASRCASNAERAVTGLAGRSTATASAEVVSARFSGNTVLRVRAVPSRQARSAALTVVRRPR